ncbi:hypothetical protein [Ralstonia solanacearum]|uniref:hypothetical protein n=2 Tax=Ralstonia TaxID=48736 RepID=UPI001F09240A|nr:hypothetical protein [Ralstonia solanacearum]
MAERFYAVAVRDIALYLELRIRRAASGVYVVFARPPKVEMVQQLPSKKSKIKWDPHSSYHSDGWRHQKSFNGTFCRQRRQPLDSKFRGTEMVVSTSLTSAVTSGILCDPQEFSDVLEVPRADILPGRNGPASVSVDLVEPETQPMLPPNAGIILQKVCDTCHPTLVVTIYRSSAPASSET